MEVFMFEIKPISPMEKVLPTREPSGEGFTGHLTALRGETVSFQIACRQDGSRKERLHAAYNSPVRVRSVDLVPCEYPCHTGGRRDDDYLADEPGLYPDILREEPDCGFPLISCQWRALWVDIAIAEEAEPGEYAFEVALYRIPGPEEQDGQERIATVSVTVEVLDWKLPELAIPHTEWFHCDCLANYYGVEVFSEQHWEIIRQFLRTAASHHCNMILTPLFTPPLDTAIGGERRTVQLVGVTKTDEGRYTFDFSRLERWIRLCRETGFRYFEMSHLFSQWGAVAAPKIMGTVHGKEERLFGWETDASGTEYRTFLHAFLPELKKTLADLGVLDRTWFHISDEPAADQLDSYRRAREAVIEDLGGCHMMDALSDFDFYRQGLVETPVCATNHIRPFLENRPPRLFAYYCTAQYADVSNRFIAQPGYRTRVLGMQLYRERIDGFLHWGYNFYNSEYSLYPINPFTCTDAGGAFPSGDPFLVYPGEDGRPVESMRLMLMDEAFQDYCALQLLESLVGREETERVLDPDRTLTLDRYPKSCAGVSELRERVNQKLCSLQRGK